MLYEWFERASQWLIFQPLYRLYTLVWWHDQPEAHICATLSPGTPTHFWTDHPGECQQMIHNRFQVVYTVITSGMWFFVLYQVYQVFWQTCVVARTQQYAMRGALRLALRDLDAHKLVLRDRDRDEAEAGRV